MVMWFAILVSGMVGSIILGFVFATGWVSLRKRHATANNEHWPLWKSFEAHAIARFTVYFCGMVITAAAEIVAWRMGVIYNIVWGA